MYVQSRAAGCRTTNEEQKRGDERNEDKCKCIEGSKKTDLRHRTTSGWP
jgi:hypothetical protein